MNQGTWARAVMLGALVTTTGCSSETDGPPPRAACIVDGDGVEICVREQGASLDDAGTIAVVALAGQPYWNSDYLQVPIGRLLENAATDGYSVRIASYDYRGIGRTAAPKEPSFLLENYANDLEAVRKKMGADRIHMFAHGWGALVAYEYLRLYPQNAAGLMLINAAAPTVAANNEGAAGITLRINYLLEQNLIANPLPPDDGDSCMPEQAETIRAQFHSWQEEFYEVPQTTKDILCSRGMKNTVEGVLISTGYDFAAAANAFTGPLIAIGGRSDPRDLSVMHEAIGGMFNNAQQYTDYDCYQNTQICDVVVPASGFFPWYEAKLDLTGMNAPEGTIFYQAISDYLTKVAP